MIRKASSAIVKAFSTTQKASAAIVKAFSTIVKASYIILNAFPMICKASKMIRKIALAGEKDAFRSHKAPCTN